MLDRDLEQIVPEWASFNKKKKDKIWQEYFQFSIKPEHQIEFDEMSKKADIIERQRFIKLLPSALRKRDTKLFMKILDDAGFVDGRLDKIAPNEKKMFMNEIWDGAASAFVGALDSRDAMFNTYLITMYKEFLMEHGRATRVLRKSKLFCPFLKHCLTQADNEMYSISPLQIDIYIMIKYAIVGGSLSFVKKLIKHDIPRLLFQRIDKCPYDCMIVLLDAIGQCIVLLSKYKEEEELKESIVEIIKECYITLLKRAISIDYTKKELKSPGLSSPAKVAEIACTFAEIFVYLQLYFKLPTDAKLKIKLKPFAMEFATKYKQNATFDKDLGCTQEEMMDMKNDANFSCYKLLTFDYSKDEVARERKLAIESIDRKCDELEQERSVNIYCGFCKKEEQEDVVCSRCAKCKMVYYCNRDCQVKGWNSHKMVCKPLPKSSLKEPLLNFAESIQQMNKSSMPAGATIYPTVFAVWLEENYGSKKG